MEAGLHLVLITNLLDGFFEQRILSLKSDKIHFYESIKNIYKENTEQMIELKR